MSRLDPFVPRQALRPRRLAQLGLQKALYWTGAGYAISKLSSSGAMILMYHSIANDEDAAFIDPRNRLSPAEFELQVAFLAKHRRIISMEEMTDSIEQGEDLPPGTVLITFDDGYHDNLAVAAPILEKYGLPAILYLPTAMISDGENPWVDELYTAFRTRTEETLRISSPETRQFDLSSSPGDLEAYRHLAKLLLDAQREQRLEILDDVRAQLSPRSECRLRPLNWQELRGMQERHPKFSLGLHSDTHIDLTAHGAEIATAEILRCKETFKRELGFEGLHFAYPYNRNNEELCRLLREHGIKTAMSNGSNCSIDSRANLLSLPRVGSPRSGTLFRLWTQGSSVPLHFASRS